MTAGIKPGELPSGTTPVTGITPAHPNQPAATQAPALTSPQQVQGE